MRFRARLSKSQTACRPVRSRCLKTISTSILAWLQKLESHDLKSKLVLSGTSTRPGRARDAQVAPRSHALQWVCRESSGIAFK
jgi:hypothetical protein